jgi:hypothetical protein
MRQVYLLIVALFTSIVISVIACSIAVAAPEEEWLSGGERIALPEPVRETGEIKISDLEAPLVGTVSLTCSYILDGTVSELGLKITALLNLAGELISTTPLVGLSLLCSDNSNCAEAEAWPVDWPWVIGLVYENNAFLTDTLAEKDEPGYEFVCTILGVKTSDTCTKTKIIATVSNNISGVLSSVAEEGTLKCTASGKTTGDLESVGENKAGLIILTEGKTLAVS